MDEENIKELINNITEKDNKQLDASTLKNSMMLQMDSKNLMVRL